MLHRSTSASERASDVSCETLLTLVTAFAGATSFTDLGDVIVQRVAPTLGSTIAVLAIGGELVALHGVVAPDDPEGHAHSLNALPLDYDLHGSATPGTSGRPAAVNPRMHWLAAPRVSVLPLATGGTRQGTLVLGQAAGAHDERHLIDALVEPLAIAIRRARAYEDAVRDRARAEAAAENHDRILAMVAHEMRNPLSPIVTATQLMALRSPDFAVKERTTIERSVARMVRTVDDLLDATRLARGKMEVERTPVELAEVVARALSMARPVLVDRGHEVAVAIPRLLVVEADGERLASAIAHLIVNAAKHTDPALGSITITAERRAGPAATIELDVTDTGAGIPPERMHDLFEPFGAQRPRGAGLGVGLAIAQGFVELHGGTLGVHSAGLGTGSQFTITLPAWVARTVDPVPVYRLEPRRILVVDDNQDAAWLLAEALRMLGHDVRISHDGAAALELARQWPPQIAFLDIGLPGMDGFALCECLGALPHRPKCVAVTGYGTVRDREKSRAAGFDRHFVKPVDLRDVQDAIASFGAMAPS